MQDEELATLEADLRSVLTDAGLQWVLDEVDRSIADGLPQERILRRRRRTRAEPTEDDYAKFYEAAEPADEQDARAAKRAGTLVITTEPYTPRQRLQALLLAVRRISIDLPQIEGAAVAILGSTGPRDGRPPAHSLSFRSEAPDDPRDRTVTSTRSTVSHDLARVITTLEQLVNE